MTDLVAIWQDLHTHPELGFEETRTSALVAQHLRDWGLDEVHEGIAGTGVVGILNGQGEGRSIGLRADMDALPITEASGLPHASRHPGVMHACGHDAHTTILLGAARDLAAARDFSGRVVFIFQPAEEGLGGARRMLDEGLFTRFPCDEIYGLHNLPQSVTGRASILAGAMMAGASFFDITLRGRGGHAARPHSASDVLLAGAGLVGLLQQVAARSVNPLDAFVLSCTRFTAGNTYNVLPEEAQIAGTLRYYDEAVLHLAERRMREICEGAARAAGVEVALDLRHTFRPLVNAPEQTRALADAAAGVLGAEAVDRDGPRSMGSEDFADMLTAVPGAYIYLHHDGPAPLHSPHFQIDPRILQSGAAIFVQLIGMRNGSGFAAPWAVRPAP